MTIAVFEATLHTTYYFTAVIYLKEYSTMQYTDHHTTCFILMLNQGSKLIVLKMTTASAAHTQRRVIKRAKTFCEAMGSNGNLYHQTDNIIPTDESS